MNIAQSNNKIYGSVEITSDNKDLNSGIMTITGSVDVLGQKAQIKIKAENGQSTNAILFANETTLQFTKRGGTDIVPNEVILAKLYE